MFNKTPLNLPRTTNSGQPVAPKAATGESSSRASNLQAAPASVKTVSTNQQSRIMQAQKVAEDAAFSHAAGTSHTAISIIESPSLPQVGDINKNKNAINLTSLYQKKMRADRKAPTPVDKDIRKETFVLEGMGTVLARKKNPNASVTYANVMASIKENSGVDNNATGNIIYHRLFSDHALLAEGTLDDKLQHAEATFKAYKEILENPEVTAQEKQYIELSYDVFKNSAKDLVRELARTEAGTSNAAQKNLEMLAFKQEIDDIHKTADRLSFLYTSKIWNDQGNTQPAASTINKNICKQTFVLEGMLAALEREKNPDAPITYASIMASLKENSDANSDETGNSAYQRLFSKNELFAGGTLDDQINQAQATFHAYKEILSNSDATEQEKQYIKLSYDVFKDSVMDLVREQKAVLDDTTADTSDHETAQKNLEATKKLEKLVFNEEFRQELRDKVTWKNLMRGVGGTAPALGVAAVLHFGYCRNLAGDFVTKQPGYSRHNWSQSVGEKAAATGIVGGTANWFITETVVPTVAYVLEKLGGRPVNPVDPKLVYPDAPKFITENGVPKELSDYEYAQAQEDVKNRRTAFKRAQAAFKLGSVTADMIGCASSGSVSVTRALLNGEFGINTGTLDVRAVGVGIGSGVRTGVLAYKQLTQTVDDVPTHTIGEPKGVKQITDGLKRANPLESANRRTWLSKVTGTMEGMALMSMLDTQVAGIDTSTVGGRLTKALGAQAETMAFLPAFLANSTAGAEVKEALAQKAISPGRFAGTRTALYGLANPNSEHIPHAVQDPDSWARTGENAYQVVRHTEQLVPQLIVDSMDALATEAQSAASRVPQLIADGRDALATGTRNAVSTAYNMGTSTLRRRRPSRLNEPLLS